MNTVTCLRAFFLLLLLLPSISAHASDDRRQAEIICEEIGKDSSVPLKGRIIAGFPPHSFLNEEEVHLAFWLIAGFEAYSDVCHSEVSNTAVSIFEYAIQLGKTELFFDYLIPANEELRKDPFTSSQIHFDTRRVADTRVNRYASTIIDVVDTTLQSGRLSSVQANDMRRLRNYFTDELGYIRADEDWQKRLDEGSENYIYGYSILSEKLCIFLEITFGYDDAAASPIRVFARYVGTPLSDADDIQDLSDLPESLIEEIRLRWDIVSPHLICEDPSRLYPDSRYPQHYMKRVIDMHMTVEIFDEFLFYDSDLFPIDVNAVQVVDGKRETLVDYIDFLLDRSTSNQGRFNYNALRDRREVLVEEYGGKKASEL